ncbi:hypothetical protein GCM10027456_25090 [Kineosporia babensis]
MRPGVGGRGTRSVLRLSSAYLFGGLADASSDDSYGSGAKVYVASCGVARVR